MLIPDRKELVASWLSGYFSASKNLNVPSWLDKSQAVSGLHFLNPGLAAPPMRLQ
jgi:hypothetical protein